MEVRRPRKKKDHDLRLVGTLPPLFPLLLVVVPPLWNVLLRAAVGLLPFVSAEATLPLRAVLPLLLRLPRLRILDTVLD
jgi:hypothetical protein